MLLIFTSRNAAPFFFSHTPMYLTANLLHLNTPRVHVYDVILSLGTLYAYDVRKSMMQPSENNFPKYDILR